MERHPTSHRIRNDQCSLCGWVGVNDRHRHDPNEGYTNGNVVIICPNEHRELHELIRAIERGEDIRFITTGN